MGDDAHVRALKFMGPILAEVLRARARHRRCGVAELAADEVSAYQDAILRGIQRTIAAHLEPPEDELPHDQRPTPLRPVPIEPDAYRTPVGVYSTGQPFDDASETTPAESRRARERRGKGR